MIGVTGGLGVIWDRYRQIVSFAALALPLALALVPATAFAGDPADAQYDSNLQQLPQGGGGGSAGGLDPAAGGGESFVGSLPFTGLDVALLAAVAVALVAAGLVLRRLRAPGADA